MDPRKPGRKVPGYLAFRNTHTHTHTHTHLSFVFLGPHPQHMEIPTLGVSSELQLPAYTTATAMPEASRVCDLQHSSKQRQILNPLSKARDPTHNVMVPNQIRFRCATTGTPKFSIDLNISKHLANLNGKEF